MTQDIQISNDILHRFAALQAKAKLAHAYLFVGPAFIGKRETAQAVAQLLLCDEVSGPSAQEPCGVCAACRKVLTRQHPDLYILESAYGETIKIDSIRDLGERIRLRPFYGRKKVFIIHNTDNMNRESGNALLKTLEEPNQDNVLLLTTANISKVLETIISRCHIMHFPGTSETRLAESLATYYDEKPIHAHFLAYMAEGCLGKALHGREHDLCRNRDMLIREYILGHNAQAYIKKVTEDKQATKQCLDILLSWFRDTLFVKMGLPESQLVHRDRLDDLQDFSQGYSFDELQDLYDQTVKTCWQLTENLNVKLPLLIIKEKLWRKS
jgi:DNA polymerase-3 subunit delta'